METYQNNIWETLSEEQWKEIIANSTSKAEVARKVNRCSGSSFNERFDKYVKEHNISIEHFVSKYGEHINDHQLQIIKCFEQKKYILPLYDFNMLNDVLLKSKEFVPIVFESNQNKFLEFIEELIEK